MEPSLQSVLESEKHVPGMVSILMVCWNDRRWLKGSLGSVRECITVPYEIVLVDNGSSDDSVAFVESEFPEVRIIFAGEDLGFIRGTNLAARHACGEFFFLLNPDTILQSDIKSAVELLHADKSIGVVGASMYGARGQLLARGGAFPSVPRLLLIQSLFWKTYRGPWGPGTFGAWRVDWVSGSWMLTRSLAWKQIGGLDERIFMYCDEMHYTRALKELGLVTVLMPSLGYIHFRGFSYKRLPYLYAGYRWFHSKFSGKTKRILANAVMKWGLRARVLIYGIFAIVLRNKKYAERRQAMRRVPDLWPQTAMPGVQFE